ncbi:MAG TPA: helix-turn-helix transcriptional regulator [Trebonia sp.]|jgi:hypothetical protein|nr:helix-turn-helix transcriptional regulator [Trebonia sp.]
MLRSELKRLRKEKDMTQESVALGLEWSTSKLIRIEGGHSSISKTDLDALLTHYGIGSGTEREKLQQMNKAARGRGWWDAYKSDIPAPYLSYIGHEAGAAFIRQFPGTVVPGLLQTQEYAEALRARAKNESARNSTTVRLRLQRQSELAERSDPPHQYYVLDEAVIRRHVGVSIDRNIMPSQLRYLADVASQNDLVTIRLIPFSAGEHAAQSGAFTVLEFDGDLPDLLYIDSGQGEQAVIDREDWKVAEYAAIFEMLVDQAWSQDDSIDFIRQVAEEMSRATEETYLPG